MKGDPAIDVSKFGPIIDYIDPDDGNNNGFGGTIKNSGGRSK